MSNLQRLAVGNGKKTLSRKARSRQASAANSRATSPAPNSSRQASRTRTPRTSSPAPNTSPAEYDDSFSDHGILSDRTGSDDELSELGENFRLVDVIGDLLDKSTKRQNTHLRRLNLQKYINLKIAVAEDDSDGALDFELVDALLQTVKTQPSEEETELALHALSLTRISSSVELPYHDISKSLKRTISDSTSPAVKASAIGTLSSFVFYADISNDEIEDFLTYMMEIIASDGDSINAWNEADPVCAALQEYGFLLTRLDDFEEDSQEAVESILDQLSSSHPEILTTAAHTIALLYEMMYRAPTESEMMRSGSMIKQYDAYRRTDEIEAKLEDIIKWTSRYVPAKRLRSSVRKTMTDVLVSIRNPGFGPGYQTFEGQRSGRTHRQDEWTTSRSMGTYGGAEYIVVDHGRNDRSIIQLDSWRKLIRYQHLTRVLKGGFPQHYRHNQMIFETLPAGKTDKGQSRAMKQDFIAKQTAKRALKGLTNNKGGL